jgi:hypothetical protein
MYVLTNEERESLQAIRQGNCEAIPEPHLNRFYQLELVEDDDGRPRITGEGWMYLAMTRKKAYPW